MTNNHTKLITNIGYMLVILSLWLASKVYIAVKKFITCIYYGKYIEDLACHEIVIGNILFWSFYLL